MISNSSALTQAKLKKCQLNIKALSSLQIGNRKLFQKVLGVLNFAVQLVRWFKLFAHIWYRQLYNSNSDQVCVFFACSFLVHVGKLFFSSQVIQP